MGTRGLIITRYRGIYYIRYNHHDSYPDSLGVSCAASVPDDPEAFEKWKAANIARLEAFEAERRAKGVETYVMYDYERDPNGQVDFHASEIEWAYTYDLDRDAFIVSCGDSDDDRVCLNLRCLPVHLLEEMNTEIVLLKRPGYELEDEEGDEEEDIAELEEEYVAKAIFEEKARDEDLKRYYEESTAEVFGNGVKEIAGGAAPMVPKNKASVAISVLNLFLNVKDYQNLFAYQHLTFERCEYVSLQLAAGVLGFLSYGAGVGTLLCSRFRELNKNDRDRWMQPRKVAHPRWEAPPGPVFWITDKVIVITCGNPLTSEGGLVDAVGLACKIVKEQQIPEKPSHWPRQTANTDDGEYHFIATSRPLDTIAFIIIRQRDGDLPLQVKTTEAMPFISSEHGVVDADTADVSRGVTECISFIVHAHANVQLAAAPARPPQPSASRFLRLSPEIQHTIIRLCDGESFSALSRTCASLRAACSSVIRLGDWTLLSADHARADKYSGIIQGPGDQEFEIRIRATMQKSNDFRTEKIERLVGKRWPPQRGIWVGVKATEHDQIMSFDGMEVIVSRQ